MTNHILLLFCFIILLAYVFELTSKFSKIPGIILLLITGIALKYIFAFINISLPDISIVLRILGSLGLILIVLEGSLDLNISRENRSIIFESLASALFLFVLFVLLFSLSLYYFFNFSLLSSFLNAVPLGIISSAVAIPSSSQLNKKEREFITYESAISDILGILLFNFLLFNTLSIGIGLLLFSMETIVSIIISVLFGFALAYMLNKITHTVKYVIILTFVVLIFAIAQIIHWPSLIAVLIFGLIMNNIHLFQSNSIRKHIDIQAFSLDLRGFKQITSEMTFLARSFFFLIFGFYTPIKELINIQNLLISGSICISIFIIRALFFKFLIHKPLDPLLYFAPRGLITILLFLQIPSELKLPFMSEGLILQIIFLSVLIMTIGNILSLRRMKKSIL